MRVLQICPRVPFPVKDGGTAAMWSIHKGLKKQNIDAPIFAINTLKHFVEPTIITQFPEIKAITIDTSVNAKNAFLNLFKKTSYNIDRFFSIEAEKKLIKLLKSKTFDIVQLEGIYVVNYITAIRENSNAKIVLRSHNIEHKIIEQQSATQTNIFKKYYLHYLANKLRRTEIEFANKYDGIAVISKPENYFYASLISPKKIIHIPFGIEIPQKKENKITDKLKFYFIGALDWQPNIEGIVWLINKVWNLYFINNKSIELHIAGKNTPDYITKMQNKNIFIHGEIEDVSHFIADKNILVCPLFSGSGMRIKLVEALAYSKPIIATKLAAEGIDLEKENCGWIAENEIEFKNKIESCISNNLKTYADNAFILAENKYNQEKITANLVQFYNSLL